MDRIPVASRRVWTSVAATVVAALVLALVISPSALWADYHNPPQQSEEHEGPTVIVEDQPIVDGTVTINEVVAEEDGWIVIHADQDGSFGPVIGYAPVSAGETYGVVVEIDEAAATETLYAMLHVDAGEKGVYEFPGPDGPVVVDGKPLAPAFKVLPQEETAAMGEEAEEYEVSQAQLYQVTTTAFLLRMASLRELDERLNGEEPAIQEGDEDTVWWAWRLVAATDWPEALHEDAEALEHELTELAEALEHEELEEAAALAAEVHELQHDLVTAAAEWLDEHFEVGPLVEVEDQPIVDGTVTINEVVAEEDGWIVIHADQDGSFGPVIGYAPVSAGETYGVVVEIDEEAATETLYAMLHVDAGEKGVYEFPGPDGPVIVDGKPLAPAFKVLPGEEGEAAPEKAEEEVVTIEIRRFSFGEPITVPVGTTVVWINKDSAPHTVTAVDGSFDSGNMVKDAEFSYTFTEPGEYPYYCRYHGKPDGTGMAGTIIVTSE